MPAYSYRLLSLLPDHTKANIDAPDLRRDPVVEDHWSECVTWPMLNSINQFCVLYARYILAKIWASVKQALDVVYLGLELYMCKLYFSATCKVLQQWIVVQSVNPPLKHGTRVMS
jgi:hypothetical protein